MTLFSEASLLSRQNLYKTYRHCNAQKLHFMDMVKDKVLSILKERAGISGVQVRAELLLQGIIVGRDRFYRMINQYRLTLNSRKKAWKRGRSKVKSAKNLIIDHTFRRVFEVLFSDYTEIVTQEGKLQLLLIEDLVSRYITAYRISKTCTAAPVAEAIKDSLALKASLNLRYNTIFHTDKGSEFVNKLVKVLANENQLLISNTGKHHCFENAFMERLNGTLKYSLGLRVIFPTKAEAIAAIKEAIDRYNNAHKHSSIGKRTPYSVLMSYTGKKSRKPQVFVPSCPLPGQGARTYSKTLVVKIKKIKLDKKKTQPKQ
jgi:putative transposase